MRREATSRVPRRDYSLDGEETRRAIAAGMADGEWYQAPIDPERLGQLTARRNGRPAADTLLWLVLLAGTGTAAFFSLGTWWAIPAFAAFGVLYGGSGDSRWHENGHGTVFAANWANDAVYNLAAFMMLREPTMWRFQHARHHSHTSIVGLDPEVSIKRPPRWREILLNYLLLVNGPLMIWRVLQHSAGYHDAYTRELVPASMLRRVAWEARAFTAILAAVIAAAAATGTIVPLLFVGLPTFYGAWLMWFFAVTQHAGLREDVLDHRMSTRTVYINPVLRFLYLNMNYHLEHHMFPTVPYYNLPALHEEIKQWLPPPKPSLWSAYREIVHALRQQRADPSYEIDRGWTPPAEPERGAAGLGVLAALPGEPDGGEIVLGGEDLLAPGQFGQVDVGSAHLLLCRLTGGAYTLTEGVCTHGRTPLAGGRFDGCQIECPKHNGRFDVTNGAAVRLPAQRPLAVHAVEVRDGQLVARLDAASLPALPARPPRPAGVPSQR
ncbi:MAG TPA: fatty acid desaturase [Acidimicrobiales bacterium]|nr:fatty acid desaturase [Acidimicrobiales bacterium]